MNGARLPLYVIGGFLGAGKTTLLNHWLRHASGRRIAVLVNDFGSISIDARLVASHAGDTIALSNGCVCCTIGNDLTSALTRIIESGRPFDAILIEASGVSDPWRIAEIALADPALTLGGVSILIDAAAVIEHHADPLLADTLVRQLQAADLLVINKSDCIDQTRLARVRSWARENAPAAPQFETVQAEVPEVLLFGPALPSECGFTVSHSGAPNTRPSDGSGHVGMFETWTWTSPRVLQSAALRALLRDMPPGVLRLKGLVRTERPGWSEIAFAGRHGVLHAHAGQRSNEGRSAVVAVGLRGALPDVALRTAFRGAEIRQA